MPTLSQSRTPTDAELIDISLADWTPTAPHVFTRYILVSTAGDLVCETYDGNTVTIPVPVGRFPLAVKKVVKTGTTAAGLTAIY